MDQSSGSPPPIPILPPVAEPGEKSVRALGWLLVALGVGLSLATALFAYIIHHAIAQGALPGNHSRWNGNPAFTRTTFQLFGAMFLFGLDAMAAGIFQIRTGRRNPWLVGIMILLLAAIALFGLGIVMTANPSS